MHGKHWAEQQVLYCKTFGLHQCVIRNLHEGDKNGCISQIWPGTGIFTENPQDWISKDVSLGCSALLPYISAEAWALPCGPLIMRKVSPLLPRIGSSIARSFVCTGQKDKSNSRVASAGFADQHPPALNKHHQTEQRHPWSTKSCGVCYSHHIQRRQPFTCKVLQRKWQKLIRQWESNTALNRLDNSCSLAGCNGKEAWVNSCPPSLSPGFDPLSNLRCPGTMMGLLSTGPFSPTWLKSTHWVPASSQQMHMIRDKGARSKSVHGHTHHCWKSNSKPLPCIEGHHLQRNTNSSILGLKGQAALYRTSTQEKYTRYPLYLKGSFPLLKSGCPINYT